MKQPNLVLPFVRGTKPQAYRQDIAKQIAQIKEHIKSNLVRAGALALNGRLDAAMRCNRVAYDAMLRLNELTAMASELSLLAPKPDLSRNPRKAATKTKVARKTYARWSDK